MASPMGYDGGITAALAVRNMDDAIRWYSEVLGLELAYRLDDMGWSELKTETNGVNLGLSQVEEPAVEGGATLTFGVKDIDQARSRLEGHGVRFDGETQTIPDMVRLATFFDPDGNKLMLYQSLAEG